MRHLFGTDGIRGVALQPPLDESTVRRLGAALALQLQERVETPHLLLAGDTRQSTSTLATWLGGSFVTAGGRVTWGGVLPTPAVSHLLRRAEFNAGVVISASHNPARDNGIKILAPTGEKLDDASEKKLERRLESLEPAGGPSLGDSDASLAERYVDLVVRSHESPRPLAGLHVVVDTANGAASRLAGPILEQLGARVTLTAADPDGLNINRGCGATAPDHVAKLVRQHRASAGLALDGDADRAVLVDEHGRVLDGDDVLFAWARGLAACNRLKDSLVVATVMSNFGLERALHEEAIGVVRCAVGDRAVWLAMQQHGADLGGEQSGHVICAHHSVSGDGLLTGTHLLALAAASGRPVSELSNLERMPQVLINVPVSRKVPFDELPRVTRELAETQQSLVDRGRVLLRYSGTEPLARVMIEGEDAAEIQGLAATLAETISNELGDPR
jgi:phosphoglucosamine mutase